MAFQRPTLAQLVERIQQDFQARLGLAGALLPRSAVIVFAAVAGAVAHGLYGYIQWCSKQLFPDQSEDEILIRHASLYGLRQLDATFAAGNIVVTGANGTVIAADIVLQRSDEFQYETTGEAAISGSTATVPVLARTAGVDGNAVEGVALTFVSPISGVNAACSVASGGITDGADQESIESLRGRLAERLQAPPLGGADADYRRWAREIAGVTRVWVTPLVAGAGTVGVIFVCDNADDIIPDSGKVAEVQAHIDELKPVTATAIVSAPTPVALDMTLSVTPDTTAVREAVEASIADLIRREAQPAGTLLLTHIREAISLAEGETDHVLTSPSADVTHDAGEIAVPGTITWA